MELLRVPGVAKGLFASYSFLLPVGDYQGVAMVRISLTLFGHYLTKAAWPS